MSKEIKFRGWNYKTKKMVDLLAITPLALDKEIEFKGIFIPFDENIELMQFTGAVDDKNKEIYDGDILSWHEDQGWEIGTIIHGIYVVEWSDDKLRYVLFDPFSRDYYELDDTSFDEVIGNIYENPGLLPKDEG